MARRFLTAEDVRRSKGAEIVIDESTVVTPQALEVAQSAGVTIRTGSGAYVEPDPDRGPDAARAALHMPLMPEPADESGMGTGIIVTAVGRNRPGVLAEITGAISGFGVDVHDISQKEMEGYFHLILTVQMSSGGNFADFKQCMECLGGPEDYAVRVMHDRVFRYMHRV